MELDRRRAREIAPFAATALLGFAVVPIENQVRWTSYGLAATLTVVVGCITVFGRSPRPPAAMRIAASLAFLAAVALLRDAGGGTTSGVAALAALPVFWLALHGDRAEMLVTVAGILAFFVTPALVIGGPEYPLGNWRLGVVFAATAVIVGITVQNLVARVRDHADALAAREQDLEAVARLSRTLSGTANAREQICAAVRDLSGARFAALLEGQSDGTLTCTADAGLTTPPGLLAPTGGPSEVMRAYSSRASVFVQEAGGPVLFEPVLRGEEAVGVLAVGWQQPPSDTRRATGLVRLLASEAAFVIERADLLGRLTAIALTDMLTGLPNRRAWDRRLEQAIRDDEPICVAILDLDLFKSYNDDYGHQAGDRLLKEAAAAWREQLRATDMLARYGGEEFVVLLPGHDLDCARRVVDRLRAATPAGQSCSAGVARREAGEEAAVLLARADHALYQAKRAGRNRTSTARGEGYEQRPRQDSDLPPAE